MTMHPPLPSDPAAAGGSERAFGKVTLIGSGEFLEPMARVHRTLLEPYGDGVNAVFVDTPAGFELNCDELAERALQYFAQRFEIALSVASYRSERATPLEISAALRSLSAADYIVAGPGSPTYAIRTWRGSSVWEAIGERLRLGAHLVLASAAAMACGSRAVPIYEIYRCGEEPRWVEGLNLLGPQGLDLAVMPHWNNASGATHDTRFCFMGEARRESLQAALPASTVLLGIDEHTAFTIDFAENCCRVDGAGSVTLVKHGSERVFDAGTTFPLAALAAKSGALAASTPRPATPGEPPAEAPKPVLACYLTELAAALESGPDEGAQREVIGWIHEAAHELVGEPPHADPPATADLAPLVQLLERARQELRAAKRFEVSDEIRDRLLELGVQPADRPLPG